MLKRVNISLIHFLESYQMNGLLPTFREICYFKRGLIILENDLSSLKPSTRSVSDLNMKFMELSSLNFHQLHLKYPFKSRYLKALDNLNNGYKSFVALKDDEIVADLWYTTAIGSRQSFIHHDLKWLGIKLGETDAYGWDMYVKKENRNNSLALYFMGQALRALKEKGIMKIYGFVFEDNSPASFLYKILRFRESKRIKANRFIFFRGATG